MLCLMLYPFFLVSCNTHPKSTRQLSVAIAGTESYISAVLQPYVEHFASKPSDWQNFLRFLVIPLGKFIQLTFLKEVPKDFAKGKASLTAVVYICFVPHDRSLG